MANSAAITAVACLLIMVAAAPHAGAAITCSSVLGYTAPCLGYLKNGGEVSANCCNGVKSLNSAADTTADRQAVCECIKSLVPSVGAKAEYVNSLPAKCGVDIPYKYSPSLDCSKVK